MVRKISLWESESLNEMVLKPCVQGIDFKVVNGKLEVELIEINQLGIKRKRK